MNHSIAYCGMNCGECPARMATERRDSNALERVADRFSQFYQCDLEAEDVRCSGCRAESGTHFVFCQSCEIRDCALARSLEHCGGCDQYPCMQLEEFHRMAPEAKERLERETVHGSIT